MTPEEQNRVIAEACGWREAFPKVGLPHPETKRGGILLPYTWVNENTHKRCQELPDYLNDLNAMAEAEKTLPVGSRPRYLDLLDNAVPLLDEEQNVKYSEWHLCTATAAQRAEAFLKTIGKWK